MCLGAPISQAASVKQAPTVTFVPVVTAFGPSFFEKLPLAEAPAEVPQAPEGRTKAVPHTDVDDQLLGKTKLCKFFARGHCSRGKACTYAHGRKELRTAPDLYKTELCFDFTNGGFCQRGGDCHYAHGLHELRAVGAPKARAAPKARGSERPSKAVKDQDLGRKIMEVEREAEQLRAQLRALEAAAAAAKSQAASAAPTSPTSVGSWGARTSLAPPCSWDSETDSECGLDYSEAPVAQPTEVERPVDVKLVVRGTFLTLAPAPTAARRSLSA